MKEDPRIIEAMDRAAEVHAVYQVEMTNCISELKEMEKMVLEGRL